MRTREPRSFNADYTASLSPCGAKTRRLIAVFVLETNYMGVKVAQREYGNATAAMIWLPCKRGSARRHLEESLCASLFVGERASNGIHVSPFAWQRPAPKTPSTSRLSKCAPAIRLLGSLFHVDACAGLRCFLCCALPGGLACWCILFHTWYATRGEILAAPLAPAR